MDAELKNFLTRNHACSEGLSRLAAARAAAAAASWAAAYAARAKAQAKWIRENIKLSDLHIN